MITSLEDMLPPDSVMGPVADGWLSACWSEHDGGLATFYKGDCTWRYEGSIHGLIRVYTVLRKLEIVAPQDLFLLGFYRVHRNS